MKKKRALTLLEVVISLSLTAILLTVLLGSATRLYTFRHRLETAKKEVLAKKIIQERLSTLFASLEKNRGISSEPSSSSLPKPTLKSVNGKELTMRLDNLIDPDSAFSGKCQAKIFVDPKKNLVLTLIGNNDEKREEVLLEGITSLQFQFFDFLEEPKRTVDSWKNHEDDLPPHIILTLKSSSFKHEKEEMFAFFLSPADNFIVYSPPIPISGERIR